MKTIHFLTLLVLALGLVIAWRIRTVPGTASEGDGGSVTGGSTGQMQSSGSPGRPQVLSRRQQSGVPAPRSLHLLAETLNPASEHTRSTLTNLAVMALVSDTLLAHPHASDGEIIDWISGQGIPEELVRERLASYPQGEETLPEIYQRAMLNPELHAVREAMTQCGVSFDPTSDGLLDCFRFVAGRTELLDFLGGISTALASGPGAAAFASEIERLGAEQEEARDVFHGAFRERFLLRHGLTEAQAEALMTALAGMKVSTASTHDLYVPRRRSGE